VRKTVQVIGTKPLVKLVVLIPDCKVKKGGRFFHLLHKYVHTKTKSYIEIEDFVNKRVRLQI